MNVELLTLEMLVSDQVSALGLSAIDSPDSDSPVPIYIGRWVSELSIAAVDFFEVSVFSVLCRSGASVLLADPGHLIGFNEKHKKKTIKR